MRKIIYIVSIALVLIQATSCNQDFLNFEPSDQFGEESVWKDPALVQTFINDIYGNIGHGFHHSMMGVLADELHHRSEQGGTAFVQSQITSSNLGVFRYRTDNNSMSQPGSMSWDNVYKNARACAIFFNRIDQVPFDTEAMRDRMKGEVHFLRAYHYHTLVFTSGGVPIITEAYGLKDAFNVPRNTFKECIDFIVSELDQAAALLPLNYSADTPNKGRATRGAALALKARVLLYAASDLYHNTSWQGGFANPELVGYVGANRNEMWQAAKDAADAVINLSQYSLYKPVPATDTAAAQNYAEMFLAKEMSEDIFVRFFLTTSYDPGYNFIYNPGLNSGANGYWGFGGNAPIGQFVDDYEMKDGTKFSWSNPAHKAAPYKGREPRFYASILHEGAKWRQRPADVRADDPAGVIQVGSWKRWRNNAEVEDFGLDTRKSKINANNGSYTGYYMRKFIDPNVDQQFNVQEVPWRFIRYTEILLIKAEAALELGQEAEALPIINMIRKRAGLPDATETGAALRDRLRHERKIELAFESQRFFDIRRWMIAPQVITNARAVLVVYPLDPVTKITAPTPTYSEIASVQLRSWNDKMYFLPIKLDEINRNPLLLQNPLY